MTIPLARITHLETAIRRRRRVAIYYNSRQVHSPAPAWRNRYGQLYWVQMFAISGLLEALSRSRCLYIHHMASLPTLPDNTPADLIPPFGAPKACRACNHIHAPDTDDCIDE